MKALPIGIVGLVLLGWAMMPTRGSTSARTARTSASKTSPCLIGSEARDRVQAVPPLLSEDEADPVSASVQPIVDQYRNAADTKEKDRLVQYLVEQFGDESFVQLAATDGSTPEMEEHLAMVLAIRLKE